MEPTPASSTDAPKRRLHSTPPKLPPGATFIPTKQHVVKEDGAEVIQRRTRLSRERHEKKALRAAEGLSPRQLRKLKKRLQRGEY